MNWKKNKTPVTWDLAGLMKLCNDPRLWVALIERNKMAWAKAYGTTEFGGTTPVMTEPLFQAGSISKPVAATTRVALMQEGKLSLDEDVNVKVETWQVPENEFTQQQTVTLRRLASHKAGLSERRVRFVGWEGHPRLSETRCARRRSPTGGTPMRSNHRGRYSLGHDLTPFQPVDP